MNPPEEQAAPLDQARRLLADARSVVVLTGSGVSAESDIPTFRDAMGDSSMQALWAEFDPQTLATPEAYEADPEKVSRWYDWRRVKCLEAVPNPGHVALADLQKRALDDGRRFTLLTQNVDGLHQRAGSTGVVELHGSIMRWRGVRSGSPAELPEGPFDTYPPTLPTGEPIRPSVVWFGEMLPEKALRTAFDALASCDLFMSIGTSAVVYPAAGFLHVARDAGAATIEINPGATPATDTVDIALRGRSGDVLPALL